MEGKNSPTRSAVALLKNLGTSIKGLSEFEARERLIEYGPNVFWQRQSFDWGRFFREDIINYFNIILIVVFFLSLIGSNSIIESLLILFFLVLSISISLLSELRFYHLYAHLLRYLQKKTEVIREGKQCIIPAEQLVPGDLIYITKGEKIPADCQIIKSLKLEVDESLLSGESVTVSKNSAASFLYAGTEITGGEAEAVVVKTGKDTEFARIGTLAIETQKKSAYQEELEKFSQFLTRIIIVFVGLVFALNFFVKHMPIQGLIAFSLVLGVSIIPELLPPITALALVISTRLFARRKTIIRRLSAIEDLGLIDILCVDKTGTITTNNLTLEKIDGPDPKSFIHLALSSSWGISEKYLSNFESALEQSLKPNEQKIAKAEVAKTNLLDRKLFDPTLRLSQVLIKRSDDYVYICLGAPEAVLEYADLSEAERRKWSMKIEEYSAQGFRVYALATQSSRNKDELGFITKSTGNILHWQGIALFRDRLKPTAKEAVGLAERLGIQVKILTGDRPEVARAVALEIGLITTSDKVWSEEQLQSMTPNQFNETVRTGHVFARVRPEMKYRIVRALQTTNQVGYLGDGINDLPVIKLANIGMVVDGAIDSSKEIADIVLLEKDLRVIVEGVLIGRKVFFNISKYLKHTMSDNFGNFFLIGILSLFLPFLPLTPVQILLTSIITDLPLFGVSLDRVDAKEITQPGHYRTKELFMVLISLGLVNAVFTLLAYILAAGQSVEFIQTVIFIQATFSGLIVFYSIRTKGWFFRSRTARIMNLLQFLALALTLAFMYTPLNHYAILVPLPLTMIIELVVLNLAFLLATDVVKLQVMKRLGTS